MPSSRSKVQSAPTDSDARRRIIGAARRHFFVQGFRRVTMDELAHELAMSKKTLYAHFPGKQSLIEAVVIDKFQRIEADLARVTSECSTDFAAGLRQMLVCVQGHAEEIHPAFVRDMQRESPELFQMVERERREVIGRAFGKLLGGGRREGFIRRDIPVSLILEILLGAIQAIVNPPKLTELGLTPRAGITAILTVILEGVITERGRSK